MVDNIRLSRKLKATQGLLDNALSRLPASTYNSSILQRSTFFTEQQIKKLFKVGENFIDKGYFSTTYSNEALRRWMIVNPTDNVLFKVRGKNGKLIEEASNLPNEAEVLFSRGTTFEVINLEIIDHPFTKGKEIFEITLLEL